jgi:hypothetical protein
MPRTASALRLLCLTGCLGALASTAAGCSHEIESPGVGLNAPPGAVTPDLACNAKTASAALTTVTIRGTNMTPMPSKTLEDKRELVLPKIELTMVTPLAGAAPLDKPLAIQDSASDPTAPRRVKWTSESEMSFDIFEEDKLPTGVMTITVTNPDGKRSAKIEKTLAIVPKPTLAELRPPAICDDQADQKVDIAGTNFLAYDGKTPSVKVGDKTYAATLEDKDCVAVDGNFTEKNVKLCSRVTITIPKGDFPVTEKTAVPVVVTNPAPADCQTSETLTLTINPPPKVDSVAPATVCEGGSQLTLNGTGFDPKASVSMDCGGKKIDASAVTVSADGKQATATFGGGAVPGETCQVVVRNPDGCEDRPLPHKTVNVVTGPIVFYADPPIVYNGVNMAVTVFATSVTRPLPADGAVVIRPSGGGAETKLSPRDVPGYVNRVQVTIPKDQAAGEYDLTLKDSSGCFATLPKAVKVVSDKTVTMRSVVLPFGYTGEDTSVTVFRDTAAAAPANKEFQSGVRLFLNPVGAGVTDLAVPLLGVSLLDKDRMAANVPKGTAVKKYDLIAVNPDGSVGVLPAAYEELATAPPVVTAAAPASVVTGVSTPVTLTGRNFNAGATFSVTCKDGAGATVGTSTATKSGTPTATSFTVNVTTSAPAGAACVVRMTNPDGSYFDFSALGVTGSSFNLSAPKVSAPLTTARRALAAASVAATSAQKFIYAFGGDGGAAASANNTYEFAPIDLYGTVSPWTLSPVTMATKRTLAGSTTVGRYVYLLGGNDGTGPVNTAERALVLSPLETPEITDVDLALESSKGLEPGLYQYRVSATFDAADTDNPGGESLASEVFSIKVPSFSTKKVTVKLVFRAPTDSLGAPVPGVSGYKVYRTAKDGAAGTETLVATVTGAATLTWLDDGTAAPGAEKPLPVGATGKFAPLPAMASKRQAPGAAAGFDPADPTTFYVYAIMGRTAAASGAGSVTGSYEFLKVTIAPNGRQSVASSWTAGTGTNGVAREEFGTWIATNASSTLVGPSDTWIYVGSGKVGNGTLNGQVDAAKVLAGGQLTAWNTTLKSFGADHAGYGVCAANSRLYVFGGQGGNPSAGAKAGIMISPVPTLDSNSWNNEGLSMTQPRYQMGSTVQSAFIFLLGGQTGTEAASKTTETVIW